VKFRRQRRKRITDEVVKSEEAARKAEAEKHLSRQRLAAANSAVIVPLSKLREENHITELVSRGVRKRLDEERRK
jgi:hypothetical protein